MNSIPPDIYERVHKLAVAIVNASEAGDDALYDSLCYTLRAYFDEQTTSERSHPFLTEAMADFTDDPAEAARLYKLSLDQSCSLPDEPTHTKMMIEEADRLLQELATKQTPRHE